MTHRIENDQRLARDRSSDIPIHPDTSSIGALVWPPTEASEGRKKGIYPEAIEDPLEVLRLFTEFKDLPFNDGSSSSDISRISARAFITREALQKAINLNPVLISDLTEGAIDLAGTGRIELDDLIIVYLGKNDSRRRSETTDMRRRIEQVRRIFNSDDYITYERDDLNFQIDDFLIDILSKDAINDESIINQYTKLYSAFSRTREEVVFMLNQPTNIHVPAFHKGKLVSAGIAELGEITIIRNGQNVTLKFAEITEAATDEDYRGRGLYTIVANHLNRRCAEIDLDFVMAESNTSSLGVIVSAKRQGRSISLDVLSSLSLPHRLLEQHVRIFEGSSDTRPPHVKNDLVPTFMTRKTLQERYGNPNI